MTATTVTTIIAFFGVFARVVSLAARAVRCARSDVVSTT